MNSKVFNNAGWIIACKIVQAVLTLIISMLSARYLGPSNFGIINYAAAVVGFVVPIMYLGINNILVQEFVDKPEQEGKILGSSIILSMISSVICICGVTAFAYVANPNDNLTVAVCFLYSILLLFQAVDMVQYWFQSKLKSKYTSIVMLFAYFIVSIYKLILLITGKSVKWFAVSNAFDYMIIAISLLFLYKKLGGKRLEFSFSTAKQLLLKGRYYIVSSMMVTIFAQTGKIILDAMMDEIAVGLYSAAVACSGITGFIFSAIIDSMRPLILEKKKENNQKEFEVDLTILYAIIIWLGVLQSFFITIFAKYIILILYGKQYVGAIVPLRIVGWYATFSYLGGIRNIWILAENKYEHLWKINLAGAVSNIILNIILIPEFGIEGAAVASLITQIFTNFIIGYIIKPIRENNKFIIKALNPKIINSILKKIIGSRRG